MKEVVMGAIEEDPNGRPLGRPRDPATVALDNRVLAELETGGGRTRNDLAELFAMPPQRMYYALDRLRKQGRVHPCLGDKSIVVWLAGGEGCP
jgi:hypothetical protein